VDDDLLNKAVGLVQKAASSGITLRIAGGVGVSLHCAKSRGLLNTFGVHPQDIDLYGFSTQRRTVEAFLADVGFSPRVESLASIPYLQRQIFVGRFREGIVTCDVGFDEARFVHRISLCERLLLDMPTLTVTDLLMMKLQMRRRSVKDFVHTAMLLAEHEPLLQEGDCINQAILCQRISNDYYCYRTFQTSLNAVVAWSSEQLARFEAFAPIVVTRGRLLHDVLQRVDKGIKWRLQRAFWFVWPEPPEPEEVDLEVIAS
jgi:hypothetical protein